MSGIQLRDVRSLHLKIDGAGRSLGPAQKTLIGGHD